MTSTRQAPPPTGIRHRAPSVPGGRARSTRWPAALVGALGVFEILMAVSAGSWVTVVIGTVGGLILVAAPWFPIRLMVVPLLLLGTLPFAVLTWSSVAGPVLALVALLLLPAVMPAARHSAARPQDHQDGRDRPDVRATREATS